MTVTDPILSEHGARRDGSIAAGNRSAEPRPGPIQPFDEVSNVEVRTMLETVTRFSGRLLPTDTLASSLDGGSYLEAGLAVIEPSEAVDVANRVTGGTGQRCIAATLAGHQCSRQGGPDGVCGVHRRALVAGDQ